MATLKAKLESPTVGGEQNDEDKSYALPATNKSQSQMIGAYQSFLAKYVVEFESGTGQGRAGCRGQAEGHV